MQPSSMHKPGRQELVMLRTVKIKKTGMSKYDVCFCGDFRDVLKELTVVPFIHFLLLCRVLYFQNTVFIK